MFAAFANAQDMRLGYLNLRNFPLVAKGSLILGIG